jgi:hypothetical protein
MGYGPHGRQVYRLTHKEEKGWKFTNQSLLFNKHQYGGYGGYGGFVSALHPTACTGGVNRGKVVIVYLHHYFTLHIFHMLHLFNKINHLEK